MDPRGITNDERNAKLARAPAWVFQRMHSPRAEAGPAPAITPRWARSCGWLSGTIAPGISIPVAGIDGRTMPEMFSRGAWETMLAQASRSSERPKLRWMHRGPPLAMAPKSLEFRLHPKLGLCFDASLTDCELHRSIVERLAVPGLGVSIAYRAPRVRYEQRQGIGLVRVIDFATLDHIAILPSGCGLDAAFPGARCFSWAGESPRPAWTPRVKAETFSIVAESKRRAVG